MIDTSGKWWKGQNPDDIIEFLKSWSAECGYDTELYEPHKCKKCGETLFTVEGKWDEQLYRVTCAKCNETDYIEDSADLWNEVTEKTKKFKCKGHSLFYITLGYALREDQSKKVLFIGYLCSECGILGCFDDYIMLR